MLGAITIGQQAFDAAFPQPKNRFTFLDAGADADPALTAAAADFSDANVHTGAAFASDYTEGFSSFLNFLYVLLAFSVVVSLFGMVNTLVLTVFERTRELGMLRTIGMTRRQARRMIRHESIITALIGAALGLPLGIFLAALVTQALSQYDIGFSIPIPELVGFTVVAILAGLAAADPPGPPGLAAQRARRPALRVTEDTSPHGGTRWRERIMPDSAREVAAVEQSPQQRQRARIAGWLMALTFFTSIPAALILYDPLLNDADYILGAGDDARVTLGALLEIFLMIGNVGTAVVMFPILRRYSETLSLSYVASRTIEATIIGVGAISLLSVVTLRDDLAAGIGANGTSLDIAGRTLVAIHDWTFLFGPGFCVGVNGILLGWLMYRTGLMPPRLAMLGVIGGPLIFLSAIAVLFGAYEQDGLHALFSLPEGAFEAAFAIYLIVKGFRPSPVLAGAPAT